MGIVVLFIDPEMYISPTQRRKPEILSKRFQYSIMKESYLLINYKQ